MRRIWIVLLLLSGAAAQAQSSDDSSYFCEPQFAGGLAYNEQRKVWESAKFIPGNKFVLKLKFVAKNMEKNVEGRELSVARYIVSITFAGENGGRSCLDWSDPAAGGWNIALLDGYIACDGPRLTRYKFNLQSNRFLTSYLQGYISGKDNNNDTPSVAGGLCTRIE